MSLHVRNVVMDVKTFPGNLFIDFISLPDATSLLGYYDKWRFADGPIVTRDYLLAGKHHNLNRQWMPI